MAELNRTQPEEASHTSKNPILIILDDVRSMHNVGSTFRTADAFAATGIWLCGFTPAPPHRDIHKTALGATETVSWQYFKDAMDAAQQAKENGFKLLAVEQVTDSSSLEHLNWNGEHIALVFGNEVTGVDDRILAIADGCIEIPQFGAKHSLNISVSVGVVLWEAVRSKISKS